MKKASLFLFLIFLFPFFISFSNEDLKGIFLYYGDSDNNGKIDTLEVVFDQEIFGEINLGSFKIYSQENGLGGEKIDGYNFIEKAFIEDKSLFLKIQEQENTKIDLIINNSTKSDLRLSNTVHVGVGNIHGEKISLSYTTSFHNYKNTAYKEFDSNIWGEVINNGDERDDEEREESFIEVDEEMSQEIQNEDIEDEDDIGEDMIGEISEEENILGEEQNFEDIENPEVQEDNDEENIVFLLDDQEDEGGIGQEGNNQEEDDINEINEEGDQEDSKQAEDTLGETTKSPQKENIFPYPISLRFQSPTYFTHQDTQDDFFICDREKSECRVNYNLQIDEGSGAKNISSKYICKWDFGLGQATGEEDKCNPNTLIYPEGDFITSFQVSLKSDENIFFSREFEIQNEGYIPPPPVINNYYSSNNSSASQGGNNNQIENIKIEKPIIEIQSGLDENNNCKNIDCSLNLKYEIKDKNELCEWDFGLGKMTGEEQKCNPSYVKYPLGEYEVTLKVYQKGNEGNFETASLIFFNKEEIEKKEVKIEEKKEENQENIGDDEDEDEETFNEMQEYFRDNQNYTLKITQILPNPIGSQDEEFIEIKNYGEEDISLENCMLDDLLGGGSKPYFFDKNERILSGESKKYYKKQTKLSINNSGYEEVNILCRDELIDQISWNFSSPEGFIIDENLERENIVKISKIKNSPYYEATFLNGEKEILRDFEDIAKENLSYIIEEEIFLENTKDYIFPKSIITLQGQISQNKEVIGNKIICHEVDTCSINLDGSESLGKKLEYFWDFGNGNTFDKKNPAAYTFEKGNYMIFLEVSDGENSDISYFFVEIPGKTPKENTLTSTKTSSLPKETSGYQDSQPNISLENTSLFSKESKLIFHIWASVGTLMVFFIGSLILLKRQKII